MAKATFQEIAALAGVGTATVERVLNARGGVRPETVEKVVMAARRLDYPRRLPAAHSGLLRIEVLLVRPDATFFRRLSRAFERIAATLNPLIQVQRTFTDEMNPGEIAERILNPSARRAALILAVPDVPAIRSAIERMAAQGRPVVNIVTRSSDAAGDFVGIDNYAAGRSAAMFMALMAPRGGTAIALAHPIYRIHRDRIRGFSDYFTAHPDSRVRFGWLGFVLDDGDRAADLLYRALQQIPDLAGLYNAGGTNSALLAVLRRHPRGRELFFAAHELTDSSRQALRDGQIDVVLNQAPEAQARRAIDLVLHPLGLSDVPSDTSPIRFVTITAESL